MKETYRKIFIAVAIILMLILVIWGATKTRKTEHMTSSVDTAQVRVIYEDTWGKLVPMEEEDL